MLLVIFSSIFAKYHQNLIIDKDRFLDFGLEPCKLEGRPCQCVRRCIMSRTYMLNVRMPCHILFDVNFEFMTR